MYQGAQASKMSQKRVPDALWRIDSKRDNTSRTKRGSNLPKSSTNNNQLSPQLRKKSNF